jgi:hypothetical protein
MNKRTFALPLLVLLVAFNTAFASAKEIKLESLKAAFIFKFTNYIDWPQKSTPFTIAVLNNDEMYAALESIFEGKKVHGRDVVITHVKKIEKTDSYDVLHVKEIDSSLAPTLSHLEKQGLLVITQSEKGMNKKAIINFYLDEEDRLKFEINADQASSSNLKINSRLLNLSKAQK